MRQVTTCRECGKQLPEGSYRSKRFCGVNCNSRFYKRRRTRSLDRLVRSWLNPNLTAADVAWVAGIIEGEGSFNLSHKAYKDRVYRYPSIKVGMVDRDVIERLAEVTGLGSATGPYKPPSRGHHQPHYLWSVARTDEAITLLAMIWPHMGQRRREQIRSCFSQMRDRVVA